jgi:hypothetical protein
VGTCVRACGVCVCVCAREKEGVGAGSAERAGMWLGGSAAPRPQHMRQPRLDRCMAGAVLSDAAPRRAAPRHTAQRAPCPPRAPGSRWAPAAGAASAPSCCHPRCGWRCPGAAGRRRLRPSRPLPPAGPGARPEGPPPKSAGRGSSCVSWVHHVTCDTRRRHSTQAVPSVGAASVALTAERRCWSCVHAAPLTVTPLLTQHTSTHDALTRCTAAGQPWPP